jgi:hypothetical protein
MLYVDLNPVRAGLVKRPEEHAGSSIHFRARRKGRWLSSLQAMFGEESGKKAMQMYRAMLYHRGAVPTKTYHAKIAEEVLEAEIARGFALQGVYAKQARYFVDGIAVGSESFVRTQLARLQDGGRYLRRKHPIAQHDVTSLREQRRHAVVF